MKKEPIENVLIQTLERVLEDVARPETSRTLGSPHMMHRLLLARLSGALGYHADIGNKKAGRIAALIDQFDEAYKRAAKAESSAERASSAPVTSGEFAAGGAA